MTNYIYLEAQTGIVRDKPPSVSNFYQYRIDARLRAEVEAIGERCSAAALAGKEPAGADLAWLNSHDESGWVRRGAPRTERGRASALQPRDNQGATMRHTTIRTAEDAVALVERVAANPGHHVLLVGPVGSGKTMIARRIAAALPPFELGSREHSEHLWVMHGARLLDLDTAWLQLRCFRSVRDRIAQGRRPFRAPHHTCSGAAICGGGASPRPGELSLAHAGVLFLDEAPEFRAHVLDAVRQLVVAGEVTLGRAQDAFTLPCAPWSLVCARNVCPCGYDGWRGACAAGRCECTDDQRARYARRLHAVQPLFAERVELKWTTGPKGEAARFAALLPV